MLDEMTPEQMDEWAAMDRIIPIGTEKLCWVMATGFAALMNRIAAATGSKDTPEVMPKKFIPWLNRKKKKKKPKYVNPNAMAAAFKMAVR
jgi:hypothetical protein